MPSRYENIGITRADVTGSQYYRTNLYPDIQPINSDYYIITTVNDRLDLMALDFYQDSSLWWIIASANALPGDSIYPPIGIQLRIPVNISQVLNNYNLVNNGY